MSNDPYNRRPLGYESATNPAPPPEPDVIGRPGSAIRLAKLPFGLIRVVWTFTAVLLSAVVAIAPAVERTFRQTGVELPATSVTLFAVSAFLRRTYLWVGLALLGFLAPFVISWWAARADDADSRQLRLRLATLLLLAAGILLTLWVVFGLFMPYTGLLQNLTSQP